MSEIIKYDKPAGKTETETINFVPDASKLDEEIFTDLGRIIAKCAVKAILRGFDPKYKK